MPVNVQSQQEEVFNLPRRFRAMEMSWRGLAGGRDN